jgi:hypothetical protein
VITACTPVLRYSFDGITWTTTYSGTQLTASRTWVTPNTVGRGDVYIRFKSQSGDYASLTTALTGNNNDLTFTAQKSGTDGNSVSMKYTNAGGTQTLLITITGTISISGSGRHQGQSIAPRPRFNQRFMEIRVSWLLFGAQHMLQETMGQVS